MQWLPFGLKVNQEMEMRNKRYKIIILILIIATASGLGFRELFPKEVKILTPSKPEIINIREAERKAIVARAYLDARKNYITLDSAWALVDEFTKDCNPTDSINIIDSTVIDYKTVLIKKDTLIKHPVFQYIRKEIEIPKEKSFWDDRFVGYVGFGPTYARTPALHRSETLNGVNWKENDYSWYWGIQFGIGIKIIEFP